MPPANDPAPPTTSTAVQGMPPATKLPPRPRQEAVAEDQARSIARLDAAAAALVLVLAFLLGSFAVRNSDFWMHLATGRALAEGTYNPLTGQDLFSYTTAGAFWTNHNWLFDLILYAAYRALGGPALVVLKALVVVALAAVLLQTRRRGQSIWLPAVCTGLALLALSPRLYLQPTVLSFLFLSLTVWGLERAIRAPAPGEPAGGGRLWWLPALFVLWANTDGWFLLGLLAVALYLVGALLAARRTAVAEEEGAPAGRARRLAVVLGLSAAACLINPSFYRVFLDWPAELSFRFPIPLLAQDSEFRGFFLSPFDAAYWHNSLLGYNVAGLAFFALALVGVVSFAVSARSWRWSRALTWLAFFVLAALRHPAVPFFAVVAGPITALNFQDALARRTGLKAAGARVGLEWGPVVWAVVLSVFVVAVAKAATFDSVWQRLRLEDLPARLNFPGLPPAFLVFSAVVLALLFYALGAVLSLLDRAITSWPLGGRLLTALAGVALLVAAWPGWLEAGWDDPYRARHVAWSLEPDASYEQVAGFLGRLRQEGVIGPDDRGFAVPPQLMNYCAWSCPQEKAFFDMRFTPCAAAARAYIDLRDALRMPEKDPAGHAWPADPEAADRLRKTFRQNHITHVILGERDASRLLLRVGPLWDDPREWVLIYIDGRTAVLGWRDPQAGGASPWEPLRWDRDRLAFGRVPDGERAPAEGPAPGKSFPTLTEYMEGTPPRSLKLDEADMDLRLFEGWRPLWQNEVITTWRYGYLAGMVGCAAPASGPVAGPSLLAYRTCLTSAFFPEREMTTPAAPPSPTVDAIADRMLGDFIVRHDSGPPAFTVLAVRAARQAVAQTPRDPFAYLALVEAYHALQYETREITWSDRCPALPFLRHVQVVTALGRALEQAPGLAPAHAQLAQSYLEFHRYGQAGFLDLALKHQREQLRLTKEAGRSPQQAPADYKQQTEVLERSVKELQRQVTDKQNQYEVRAASLPVLQKAQLALSLGLAEQALDVLWESDVVQFGKEGARLELELLLCTGSTRRARVLLYDQAADLEKNLGAAVLGPYSQVPAAPWYRLVLAAAEGDYRQVDDGFEALLKGPAAGLGPEPRMRLARVVIWNFMNTPSSQTFVGEEMRRQIMEELAAAVELEAAVRAGQQEGELQAYRGLFALEAGDNARAAACFRQALAIAEPPGRFLPYLALLGAASPLQAAALTDPAALAAEEPTTDFPGREAAAHFLALIDEESAPRPR